MASTVLPNGIIIPEKYSRDWYADLYHNWQELDNLLGGGTPKDGTLTIQKNGDTVGTFSANQATDETINITVPDVNDATLTIQQNGTNVQTFTANSSTNKTANIQCVDLSTAQTIGGVKTFSQEATMFGRDINLMSRLHYGKNSNPSAASWNYLFFRGNTATEGYTDSWYSGYLEQLLNTNGSARGRWLIRDTSENSVCLELSVNGSDKQVRPQENNTVELGTSTNKWKSFNGINPGALSLPSTYINVDTTNWVLDGSQPNHFVPTSDGWFGIQCTDTVYDQTHYVFVGRTGGGSAYYQQNLMSSVSALWDSKYHGCVFIPVIKNINYDIRCICSNITATFYPCQGNV